VPLKKNKLNRNPDSFGSVLMSAKSCGTSYRGIFGRHPTTGLEKIPGKFIPENSGDQCVKPKPGAEHIQRTHTNKACLFEVAELFGSFWPSNFTPCPKTFKKHGMNLIKTHPPL